MNININTIQFGMPTLIETKNIEECVKLCKELELNFIELNMNLPQYQAEQIDAAYFSQIAKDNGIFFTIHLDENLNPYDFNKAVADAYIDTVMQTIDIAKKLSIPVINMHFTSGVHFKMPDRKVYLYDEYKDIYLEKLKHFRDQCEQAIGNADIKICVENTGGYMEFQREGLSLLLKSKVFGLTFDIGHNAGAGGVDEAFIMERENRLCHMHFHDVQDDKMHLALGAGELDLLKYFSTACELGCRVVLETKTIDGLKQSVRWVKHIST